MKSLNAVIFSYNLELSLFQLNLYGGNVNNSIFNVFISIQLVGFYSIK